MRKIPNYLENQFDNIFIHYADKYSGYYNRIGLVPNDITTLSFIFGLLSIVMINNKYYIFASNFYLIAYYYDCVDGYMARKYNQITVFGDYYDHITDLIVHGIVTYQIFSVYSKLSSIYNYLPFLLILGYGGVSIHFGCQEIYYNKINSNSKSLNILKKLCPSEDKNEIENIMKISRYFGLGSVVILQFILIILMKYI
jgi:phosphatidylglycerophosphate synthase